MQCNNMFLNAVVRPSLIYGFEGECSNKSRAFLLKNQWLIYSLSGQQKMNFVVRLKYSWATVRFRF